MQGTGTLMSHGGLAEMPAFPTPMPQPDDRANLSSHTL